jgi:hypothetical protein
MTNFIAQRINNPALGPSYAGLNGIAFFGKLFPTAIAALLVIGTVVFVFMLLTGGISYITAGGDKGKVEEARQRLTNALIGLLILFSFFAILNIVECFFGIGLRQITIAAFNITFAGTPVCQ